MKLRLRHKVTGLALLSALLPVVALLALNGWQERRIGGVVMDQFEERVESDLSHTVRELYGTLQTANGLIQARVDVSLEVARSVFTSSGNLTFGPENVTWDAINQVTQQHQSVALPEMKLGGVWLGQNSNLAIPTPVVDRITKLVGGTCTIFQRIDDAGSMLRVATNVETLAGNRAIGTFIPSTSPVVQAVLSGKTYRGPAYVVNAWYLSDYEPITDASGRVVGMLYVGVKQEADNTLRETINSALVGNNGYVWVAYGRNTYNLPPFVLYGNMTAPTKLEAIKNIAGQPVFPPLIQSALRAKPGKVQVDPNIAWRDAKDPNDASYFEKDIAFVYYQPWDWVIGITAYDADTTSVRATLRAAFNRLRYGAIGGAFVLLIGTAFLATYLGRRIASPITFLTKIARQVADGDLASAMASAAAAREGRTCVELTRSRDETGQLFEAICTMLDNLQALLGRVQTSSRRLQTSASNLAIAAREQEGSVQDFGASTSQIAAAVKEISATAQELSANMTGVATVATQTASTANAGRSQIESMNAIGEELTRATTAISNRLTAIADKARNINSVITTITKVADQTNLLSLNAAIEAEKAGDFGLGFSVVAREIRRLADQTAEATLDIEQMVKEMQSAVSAGVMEMDKFSEAVRNGGARREEVTGHIVNIIQQVEDLNPRLASVKEGMSAQSQGARQISDAVSTLNQAALRTNSSLDGFKAATRTLNDAVSGLQEGVASFRLEPESGPAATPVAGGPAAPSTPPAAPPAGSPAPFPRARARSGLPVPGAKAPFPPRPSKTPPKK